MKRLLPVVLCVGAGLAQAQSADEIDLFAAMIERPEGTPFATATAVAGEPGALVFLTAASVSAASGACLRVWDQGPCHPLGPTVTPLPGQTGLSLVVAAVPQEDMNAKFSSLVMTRQPLVGTYDATSGEGLTFSTQNALGGWERPLTLATPSGQSSGQVVLGNDAFSTLSTGAPLVHPEDGLVGIVSRAASGSALMLPIREALLATQAAGVSVPAWMLPDPQAAGGLPPRVESEIGRMVIFSDYSYIGYLGGFYGPSQGTGFDESFTTTVDFSVWEVDLSGPRGAVIASSDRTLPLIPTGMPMEAPFTATPGDHLATCMIHATPSSEGRPVYVVQFWRSVPERYKPNIDDKDYEQAAPPMTGWADGDTCAGAISSMGADRVAALTNAPASPSDTPPDTASEAPLDPAGEWTRVVRWAATGRAAFSAPIPDGRVATVGCTESEEAVIAIRPGADVTRIHGTDVRRTEQDVSYVFLPESWPGEVLVESAGTTLSMGLPPGIPSCKAGG